MKTKKFLAALVMSAAIAAAGCGLAAAAEKVDGYMKITPQEAMKIMEYGSPARVILDVRSVEEYNGGHVPGAIVIPHDVVGEKLPEILPDRNTTILVYCRSGKRAETACKALVEAGYINVLHMGGILGWPYTQAK